ncbi:hypothetical protein FHG87_012988 [Trinorchestia longiramus]|nr:hypothetical protein FHG87_012988 [Trinorchestia longiramus]
MILEIVDGYSRDFKVKFGGDKSKVMVINGGETDRDREWNIGEVKIGRTKEYKYLGCMLSEDGCARAKAIYDTILHFGKFIFNQSEEPLVETISLQAVEEPVDEDTPCSDADCVWWQQVTPLQHLLLNVLIVILVANLSLVVVSWWYYQARIAYTLTRGRSAAVDEILRRHTATKSSRGHDK